MTASKIRLGREHQDKRLRVEFSDGEIAEIKLLLVSQCDQHQDCNGITYDIISTNRSGRIKQGAAFWSDLTEIKSFDVLGD
jgi:hypothetical protein